MNKLFLIAKTIHQECESLCGESFDEIFDNSGNLGIFCQSGDEFVAFTKIAKELTQSATEENRKYFELIKPIHIQQSRYTHLYIRKPDSSPYGKHRGDVDFYVDDSEYEKLLAQVKSGKIKNASSYTQTGVGEMIELSSAKYSSLAYVSTKEMVERIRFRW